jgi:hypothetical protein
MPFITFLSAGEEMSSTVRASLAKTRPYVPVEQAPERRGVRGLETIVADLSVQYSLVKN